MRVRIAAPILLASASVMIGGLVASAQQQPQVPTPRLPLQTQQRIGPALKQQIQQRQAQKQAPAKVPTKAPPAGGGDPAGGGAPGGGSAPGAGGAAGGGGVAGGGTGNIQEFETGIEFRATPPGARVTFNLEDADLPDLVRLVSSITGKRFILPGKARSIKATVYAPTKVTAAEAYQAFLSILELNGMTVVPSGRYLKIVESAGIENQPIPTYTGGSATPRDDRFVTRMHHVENVSAEDVATLLTRFKSREGNVTAYAPTNTIIVTDMGSNIRRMMRVLEAIDVPRTGEQIWIEPIHYANATELAARLQEIFPVGQPTGAAPGRPTPPTPGRATRPGQPAAGAQGGSTVGSRSGESRITKILPDERTNSLIILATERAYMRILELIRQLDVPLEGEGRIHVHYVQHGDAEEIANTLSSLITGNPTPGRGAQAGGAAGAAAGGTDIFEGQIRVTAHKPSNALVITSSLHDYAALRRVIERLDAPRRQVFLEAVIMELSVNRSRNLGISFHAGAEGFPAAGSLLLGGSNAQDSLAFPANPDALTGLALGVRGPEIEGSTQLVGVSVPAFGIALNALATSGDADILSTPHIIAMDNEEAEISVGQNIPLQTSSLGGLASLAGLGGQQGQTGIAGLAGLAGLGGGGFGGSVPRQDVGTTIRVTPHINESDEIRLEIQEEISEAGAPSADGNLGVVSISKRTAKTQMVVRDQQTVVIGGLMRDRIARDERKIPILGDIPLLGVLFRQTVTRTEKTNLLLFLTPYIIRDSSDLRMIFERKMRERQEFIDRYFVFGDHDYDPPVDYSRTRGLFAEIMNELAELEVERLLLEEAQARPPPEHVPRSAVGAAPEMESSGGQVVISPEAPNTGDISGSNVPDLPGSVPDDNQQEDDE